MVPGSDELNKLFLSNIFNIGELTLILSKISPL
jgi:hypothetical protein